MILPLLMTVALLSALTYYILGQKKFGKAPSGTRLQRILKSPNYKDGKFVNLSPTPQITEGSTMAGVIYRYLVDRTAGRFPKNAFNLKKTDLHALPPSENVYVWMGHSSYFLQAEGKKFLVDPVLSGYASPFSFTTNAYKGADLYGAEDIPELDFLVITHDHWDHLDFETVPKLFSKIKKIITGLGTGAHLEFWGFNPENIIELDWYESRDLGSGFSVIAQPSRHFSGRGFKRDQAIWASFLLVTPLQKIYIGGDSGYDAHFKNIGEKYGSIDLAILENGQYNRDWRYIHMLPGEQLKAMKDMNAQRLIPVHNSKFTLAQHPWKEPLEKMAAANTEDLRILYPKIGEKIFWQDDARQYEKWWENLE